MNTLSRLGRCKRMEDVIICGKFDPSKIRCHEEALTESLDLEERANMQHIKELEFFDNAMFLIGYVNIRSMRLHWEDVMQDEELMKCDIIGLGETWLNEPMDVTPFYGNFINDGKGKGIASLTKGPQKTTHYHGDGYSILHHNIDNINIIFVYFSKTANSSLYIKDFAILIRSCVSPTIIMGDVNFNYSGDNHPFERFMISTGFTQIVKEPTHLEGNIIDHIYLNKPMEAMGVKLYQHPVYFSDHDKIIVRINSM